MMSEVGQNAGSVRNRGWQVTSAAIGINLALGILYSWSVFSKRIPDSWQWTEANKSWPYAIACLVFSLVMVPAGRLQDRFSPRLAASIGGLLVGAGMLLAGASTSHMMYVLGFGVLAGAGIGFGYASATPPAVKWFPPRRTGLIAGLVVSGFGLSPAYSAKLSDWLIATVGPQQTMSILGVAFLVVVLCLAQLLVAPPKGYVPPGSPPATSATARRVDFAPGEVLRTWQFYLLWQLYACGAGAGLMIIGKLAKIGEHQADVKLGFMLVACLAIGNGAGRILAGMASDRIGRNATLSICFGMQCVLMLLLTQAQRETTLGSVPVLAVISALIGANYGANLALFPAITKDYYGLKNFGMNYGLVFTAWGIGGFFLSMLAGQLFDKYHSFTIACQLAAGLLAVAAIFAFVLRPPQLRTTDAS